MPLWHINLPTFETCIIFIGPVLALSQTKETKSLKENISKHTVDFLFIYLFFIFFKHVFQIQYLL